jgi:hypothetical protein
MPPTFPERNGHQEPKDELHRSDRIFLIENMYATNMRSFAEFIQENDALLSEPMSFMEDTITRWFPVSTQTVKAMKLVPEKEILKDASFGIQFCYSEGLIETLDRISDPPTLKRDTYLQHSFGGTLLMISPEGRRAFLGAQLKLYVELTHGELDLILDSITPAQIIINQRLLAEMIADVKKLAKIMEYELGLPYSDRHKE